MLRKLAVSLILAVVALVFASSNPPIARITVQGRVIEDGDILQEQVQEMYEQYLAFYGSFEPVFEEPYVRVYILSDLIDEKVKNYLAKQEGLSTEEFEALHSQVTDAEMRDYYEKNREKIIEEEEYVDLDYAYFSDEKSAKEFMDIALREGFEVALQKVEPENWDSYDGLKKSEVGTMYHEVIFGKSERSIRLFPVEDGFFIFNVRNHNDLSTYEKFKNSVAYSVAVEKVGREKLSKYIEMRKTQLKVAVSTRDAFLVWLDLLKGSNLENAYKAHRSKAFDRNNNVVTKDVWVLSGLIALIDEAEKSEEYKADYEKLIRSIYAMNYKTWPVVARMRKFDNSEMVKLDYNVELAKLLISDYLSQGEYFSVAEYITQNLKELEELSVSKDRSIVEKALEYLYRMNRALHDFDNARMYLQKLEEINPNYLDFDAEYQELEELEEEIGSQPGEFEWEGYEWEEDDSGEEGEE